MESFVIKKAVTREDFVVAVALVEQLAHFEKLNPPDEAAKQRFVYDGCERSPPRFEVWLAEIGTIAVGYILIFETYSTFLCKPTLYLEDIFVLPDYRHQKIGGQLLQHCLNLAKERGCGRMEWTCLDWNKKAQQVYENLGAVRMSEWYLYRLTAGNY
jgi:GNAT superfamily N-acetyltransferase